MLKIGIIGLAQAGKTTLFRILTRAHGSGLASGRPEAHVGVVHVPDARLDRLKEMYQPEKTVYASIEYVDTAGSVIDLARAGAQTASLREMDALAHVVRAFDDAGAGPPDTQRDIENVELELIPYDLAVVATRLIHVGVFAAVVFWGFLFTGFPRVMMRIPPPQLVAKAGK